MTAPFFTHPFGRNKSFAQPVAGMDSDLGELYQEHVAMSQEALLETQTACLCKSDSEDDMEQLSQSSTSSEPRLKKLG